MQAIKGKEKKQKSLAAVERLLSREGFQALGVNAAAREAGVDKVRIYRYFGSLPGLLKTFAWESDYWPVFNTAHEDASLAQDPVQFGTRMLLQIARELRDRPGLNSYDATTAWGGAVVSQATTIAVRDSAAYLDWTSRRIKADVDCPIPGSLLASTLGPTPKLRIGFTCESPVDGPVDSECIRGVEKTAHLLETLGHHIEPCTTPYNGWEVMRALLTVIAAYTRKDLQRMGEWVGRNWRDLEVEPPTRFLAEVGGVIDPALVEHALATWEKAAAQMEDFHRRYDVLLTPTVATLPLPASALSASTGELWTMRLLNKLRAGRFLQRTALFERAIGKGIAPLPFMQIANMTGAPAMSVPIHWSEKGLPVGSHFMAAKGQDALLFNLATQLERSAPWRDKRPPLIENALQT